jgi:hypothetical protein
MRFMLQSNMACASSWRIIVQVGRLVTIAALSAGLDRRAGLKLTAALPLPSVRTSEVTILSSPFTLNMSPALSTTSGTPPSAQPSVASELPVWPPPLTSGVPGAGPRGDFLSGS